MEAVMPGFAKCSYEPTMKMTWSALARNGNGVAQQGRPANRCSLQFGNFGLGQESQEAGRTESFLLTP